MQKNAKLEWYERVHVGLDSLLFRLSTYVLPILIAFASVFALVFLQSQYETPDVKRLPFSVLEDAGRSLTPTEAFNKLTGTPELFQHNNRLSESPFWFAFSVEVLADGGPVVVELPSRHAMNVSCWDAQSLQLLGRSDRETNEGRVTASKTGFALALGQLTSRKAVLCRSNFVGPGHLTIDAWPDSEYQTSLKEFQRKSGLMDGGLSVLSIFVLITALFNRQTIYLLFSGWLIINLRMAALSAGWDAQWLDHTIPQHVLSVLRPLTLAIYYTVTIVLFKALFRNELEIIGYKALWRFAQWTCLPLLLLALAAPYKIFLPIVWALSGYCIGVGVFSMYRILKQTPSVVAVLYSASLCVTLFASLYEVISAALGFTSLIGSINSVTAAMSSSLLASLAIAAQINAEHKQWVEAKAEMEHTYEAMPIGLFTLDVQGRFLSANPALMKMLGRDVLARGGDEWQDYFSEEGWVRLYQMVRSQTEGEIEIDGSELTYLRSKRYVVKATLARGKIEGSLQDITEKSRAEADLRFMADNDVLTKVLNRRGIENVFMSVIAQTTPERPLALAYLDLDRFKLINDLYGHPAGDEVLQQVCGRIQNLLSGSLQIGRVGGDEFVIVLPDTRIPLATLVCQAVVECISNTVFQVGNKAFHVRASIGLIEVSPGTRMKDAISTADRACREAKKGGGQNLVVYETGARAFQEHEAELKLIELLATPTATDAMFLVMQPIMSLTAPLDSLNFEVLLRMRDEQGQLIPTERLISAAEQSGRMGMIDRWVLSSTLAWLNTHASRLSKTKFICMNLSGASFNDEAFMNEVFTMLANNAHLTSYLCIEVTEGVALHDLGNTQKIIHKMRSLGAKVALDDFGAGYTSFSYLKNLSGDLLKIDGSFIVNMNSHPANIAIVEAIVNLAGNLGMKVIAEWAEDFATVQTLAEIGVDYVQGFVVAKPQEPAMLLMASSSASYIRDEALAQYVRMIGSLDTSPDQYDLNDKNRNLNLH